VRGSATSEITRHERPERKAITGRKIVIIFRPPVLLFWSQFQNLTVSKKLKE
jgi:hypothetical protein